MELLTSIIGSLTSLAMRFGVPERTAALLALLILYFVVTAVIVATLITYLLRRRKDRRCPAPQRTEAE